MKHIKEILKERLGEPDNQDKLQEYIRLLESDYKDYTERFERHHILPRAEFPELENEKWNLVSIPYSIHCKSHQLLFEAYNTRRFQRPLNFMKADSALTTEQISNAAKRGWVNLKNNEDTYNSWRSARSKACSEQNKKNWDDETYREKTIKFLQTRGITPENRKKLNESRIGMTFTEEHKKNISKGLEERYKDEEFKAKFDETMNEVNKDPEKRAKAGESIVNKWKDPEYREKQKKSRTGVKWWNNGETSIKSRECPGPGWVRGRYNNGNLGRRKK